MHVLRTLLPLLSLIFLMGCSNCTSSDREAEVIPESEPEEATAIAASVTPRSDQGDWSWPPQEVFYDVHAELHAAAEPIRVVVGGLSFTPSATARICGAPWELEQAHLGLILNDDDARLVSLGEDTSRVHSLLNITRRSYRLKLVSGLENDDHRQRLVFEAALCGELVFETTYISPVGRVSELLLDGNTYVGGLLDQTHALYDGKAVEGDIDSRKEAFQSAIPDLEPELVADWEEAWAAATLLQSRRYRHRFPPLTKNEFPQVGAKYESREICTVIGDLACYLNLQLILLNGAFTGYFGDRWETSRSPYIPDPLFEDTPIDVERFFLGLVSDFVVDGELRNLSTPVNLGPVLVDQFPELVPVLIDVAADENVDEYNRMAAGLTVYYGASRRNHIDVSFDIDFDLVRQLLGASLSPATRSYVEKLLANESQL